MTEMHMFILKIHVSHLVCVLEKHNLNMECVWNQSLSTETAQQSHLLYSTSVHPKHPKIFQPAKCKVVAYRATTQQQELCTAEHMRHFQNNKNLSVPVTENKQFCAATLGGLQFVESLKD